MSPSLSRRHLLFAGGAAALGVACRNPAGEPGMLRLGLVASLSHGPALAALRAGTLAQALAPLRIEARLFRAGPRVVEALVGGAVDIGITGPAPVVATHSRHGGRLLRVLAGVASGGASLVVRRGAPVTEPRDLRGRAVAVTQVGNTQDISLRTWLAAAGVVPKDRGGDVTVYALAAPVIKGEMAKGNLDAAWLPEPWGTRLVQEIGATRLLDERALWPDGLFATAIAVARTDFLAARGPDVERALAVLRTEGERARLEPARTEELAYEEIRTRTGNAGPRKAFREAMAYVDFTEDCMQEPIARFAQQASATGLFPPAEVASLFAAGARPRLET